MLKVLILRKCTEDFKSHNGKFQYPEKGYVEAPDWQKSPVCGRGLHGLLWGHGSFNLDEYGTLFQVIEAESENVIEFDGKCKFKGGEVLLTGSQQDAITLLKSHPNYPKDNILNYDIQIDVKFAVAGYRSTLTGGYRSTLTVGDETTLTGGYRSTLTGGYRSTLTGGDGSTLTGGYRSTLTGGDGSTLTGGDGSTLTGGDGSTFEAGVNSVLIVRWRKGSVEQVTVKIITKTTAGKTYKFEDGKFNLVKKEVSNAQHS